jgi:hypothetical protein
MGQLDRNLESAQIVEGGHAREIGGAARLGKLQDAVILDPNAAFER